MNLMIASKHQTGAGAITVPALVLFMSCHLMAAEMDNPLVNPGFEEVIADGVPAGWTILTGLDEARYGPPKHEYTFDDVRPVVASPGRGLRGSALVFPRKGIWQCQVGEHSKGIVGNAVDKRRGQARGKATAYQIVELKPGWYRFGAYLRTADGDGWSGSFSLGVATNGTTDYAHDDSTGIKWTKTNLGMKGNPSGEWPEWGEWQWRDTEPFEIKASDGKNTRVSVWICFHYVNEHQTKVRWEIDDAAIPRAKDIEATVNASSDSPEDSGEFSVSTLPLHLEQGADVDYLSLIFDFEKDWESLRIRFRETDDSREGFILTVTADGTVILRSRGDGVLYEGAVSFDDNWLYVGLQALYVDLQARGQHGRFDMSKEDGFEARLIGPSGNRTVVEITPPDSALFEWYLMEADESWPPRYEYPVSGEFRKIYDPSVGEDKPWYINDHCFVRTDDNLWHMIGITHAEPFAPSDEDFFAHAITPDFEETPWQKQSPVCHVNAAKGETHVWAPHIVRKDDTYYMFYCGGGKDGDAYQMNLRTSKDLETWTWHEGNPLFVDIGNARDPMVLQLEDGTYLMYYTRPASREERYSAIAVRESKDLLNWSEPSLALVTNRKEEAARLTESPFVFKRYGAYYLSATGIGGGYRGTWVWRSLNPRRFDFDNVVAQVNSHAPEWIDTDGDGQMDQVTHCGWGQGGVWAAPVEWKEKFWTPFGLLVVRGESEGEVRDGGVVEIRRKDSDRRPYRTLKIDRLPMPYALPPGRYRVTRKPAKGPAAEPKTIEIVADERMYIARP